MFDKMKQLMEMKKQADQIKRELDNTIVDHEGGGVKFSLNGAMEFKSINIDEQLILDGNKPKLEAEILNGVNAAIRKSQALAAEKMKGMMPGLPGM